MEFLDTKEAEKSKKQKWLMFCGTSCIECSGLFSSGPHWTIEFTGRSHVNQMFWCGKIAIFRQWMMIIEKISYLIFDKYLYLMINIINSTLPIV